MERLNNSLNLFFPGYSIEYSSSLKIDKEKKIIYIHKSSENLPENVFLGLIMFLFEKNDTNTQIENQNLDELEKEQLIKVYEYLSTLHNVPDSIILGKKDKIKKFLNYIGEKISSKGPLWEFIKQQLIETKNISIEELVDEYLEFKGAYLQSNCEACENIFDNELVEDEQTYHEHTGGDFESLEGEDSGVIGFLDPIVRKTYFVHNIYEKFDLNKQKFISLKTNKTEIPAISYEQILSNYNINGKKGKTYVLPLSKDLKIVGYNTNELKVYQDEYGRYFINFLKSGNSQISIGSNNETNDFNTDNVNKTIYTGSKINLGQFSSWKELRNFIKQKKYKNVSQQQFHGKNVNTYIENLFSSNEMDCLPANILFTILARSLGYKTRFISGYQTYIKDEKTYVSTNQGHAWSEIFIDGKWVRVDATPVNSDEQENENNDLDNTVENIIENNYEDNPENKQDNDFQLKDGKDELSDMLDKIPDIESKYFKSALEYIKKDAEDIINYIQKLLEQRKEFLRKQKLKGKPKRMKRGQTHGKLKITPDTISHLAVGDPRIFERKLKLKGTPNEDIDTRLKDISIAIDVSGSMGRVTGNWENGTKLDSAYLSVVLIYAIAKGLDINFENVTLFSNKCTAGNPEEILKKFEHIPQWGNEANTIGIKTAIKSIQNTQKGVVFVISDGDSATGTRFFDDESRKLLLQNKNLLVVGYGIGEDATAKLEDKISKGVIPTVIEYRMKEASIEQSKGFNVKEYHKLVDQLKKHLENFMTAKFIKL